jgi:uncharacterized membrane protein YeiH
MPALPPPPNIGDFIHWIGLAAVAVFAITGALEAGLKRMDLVGVIVVALATALGGGTIRDILLNRPLFWLFDPTPLIVCIVAALATFVLARTTRLPAKLFLIPDAIGLALFSIIGTQIALDYQVPWLPACLLGVITGTFGGVLRDLFCAEIPLIFLPGEFYATAALGGALVFVGLLALRVDHIVASGAGMLVAFALRLISITLGLRVPTFRARE